MTQTEIATSFDYVRAIGDKMCSMSSVQLHDLQRYLRDEYGFVAPEYDKTETPVIVKQEMVEVQTIFDLVLTGVVDPGKKIVVIKEVRALTGLGLAESKAAVDGVIAGTVKTLKEAMPKAEAEKAKATIEAAGGKVELK